MKLMKPWLIQPILILLAFSAKAADTTAPRIVLNGGKTQSIQIGSVWILNEPRSVSDDQTDSADISVEHSWGANGPVNTAKRGVYVLFILATDLSNNYVYDTVTYRVDDYIPPAINLNTPDKICVQQFSVYNRVAASATDNYYDTVLLELLASDVNVNIKGLYTDNYKATDGSGNVAYKNRIVEVNDCNNSGVQDISVSALRLFPNPASDVLYWQTDFQGPFSYIALYNAAGIQLWQQPLNANGKADISGLTGGVYHVLVYDGTRMRTERILIAR